MIERARLFEAALLLWAAAALAGCAGPIAIAPGAGRPVFRDPSTSVSQAAGSIEAGRDDRASVEERLGPAERLRFTSGYEVWVWRDPDWRRQAQGAELLVLFDPAGRVSKVRTRRPGN